MSDEANENAAPAGDLWQSHEIPSTPANDAELAHAGIPATSFYLVRPDGHIGLCGMRLEVGQIERYFSERLSIV